MKQQFLEKLQGKQCKIVIKEPNAANSHVVTGMLHEINQQKGCIIVESHQGIGYIKLNTVVAIKPKTSR